MRKLLIVNIFTILIPFAILGEDVRGALEDIRVEVLISLDLRISEV